jgi:hypothetical protein
MPKLVRLYVTHVLIGFGLALAFVALLLGLDVAGLRHLILGTEMGWLGGVMLVAFNGIVFAGVQFGIAVMRLAEDEDPPRGRPAPEAMRLAEVPVARPPARPAG